MFRSLIPVSLLVAVFVAACSGSAGTTQAPATPAPVTAAPPTAAPPSLAATGPTVSVASAGFFVGPSGMTLYSFDKDAADKSNCAGQCATNWPALTVSAATAIALGTGLGASDFGTITGADGSSLQVTYHHVPLYYFAGDSAPGDKNGDGVGRIWHLATAATGATASAAPSATPSPAAPASAAGVCYDDNGYKITCPPASAGASPSPAAGSTTVSISSAGNIVSSNGMSLYQFDKDTTAGQSACTGSCATNWPAFTVPNASSITVGTGLDPADYATITRSDGTLQVTYYGKPLYWFSGDSAPTDTNGDGVLGLWHLAKPQ